MPERGQADGDYSNGLFNIQTGPMAGVSSLSQKRADTVGYPPITGMGVPNMPSWKAKKLRKLPREKVLLEL
jgi:hypothetical protein